ncbi:unnamed protein product [Rhodiola kirilowii]
MVVVMKQYEKGDQVEVKNTKVTLEDSWHPARIVGGHGDVYTVLYDEQANGVVEERVFVKCIRPRPPVVAFSNWSRGDLVHVYHNSAWMLATVLEVLEKNQFLVRIVGSMKNLIVDAAWIRIRHYWQGDQWIVVGKGPSKLDVKRLVIHCKKMTESHAKQRKINILTATGNTLHKSHTVSTKAIKRSAPDTQDQTEVRRRSTKISRTAEKTSPCTLNHNKTEPCTGTEMRSKVTKEHQGLSRRPAANATLRKTRHLEHEDSSLSSVGSCSINSNCLSHHDHTQCAEHQRNDDDAESYTGQSPKPRRNQTSSVSVSEKAILCRPAKSCSLVLRFRLQNARHPGAAL